MKLVTKVLFSTFAMVSAFSAFADAWPVGNPDNIEAAKNTAISIDVLDNDTGGTLTLKSVNESSVGWGRITINEDKTSLTYTPYNDYTGTDEFWYVLEDEYGRANAAKVTVVVNDNGWPQAVGDVASAAYGEELLLSVLDNDTGEELRLVSANEWSSDQGKVSVEGNYIKYQQVGDARGEISDEFWYVFEDKWGRKNAGKVVVSLSEGVSTAWPVANVDTAEAKNGLRAIIPVLDNDVGEGLTITKSNEWTANGGKTEIVDDVIRYTPSKDFTGSDHFWYDFEDKYGRANSAKVTVEVTQNTQTSVVEFCGTNYASDGTIANTAPTEQVPVATVLKYSSLDKEEIDSANGEVEIDNRRYYLDGAQETGLSLWVETDGTPSKLVDAEADEALYLVGAYDKQVYYAKGLHLFAHDGLETTDLGDLFVGLTDTSSETEKLSITSSSFDNVLYILAQNSEVATLTSKVKTWRVSDGLGLHLMNAGTKVFAYNEVIAEPVESLNLTNDGPISYFSGFEYHSQQRHNYWRSGSGEFSFVRSSGLETLDRVVYYTVESSQDDNPVGEPRTVTLTENNDRLFITTVPTAGPENAKLYVADPDGFIELATCEG